MEKATDISANTSDQMVGGVAQSVLNATCIVARMTMWLSKRPKKRQRDFGWKKKALILEEMKK